jgi:hypothetical protein
MMARLESFFMARLQVPGALPGNGLRSDAPTTEAPTLIQRLRRAALALSLAERPLVHLGQRVAELLVVATAPCKTGETLADVARTYNVDPTTIGRLLPSPFDGANVVA